MRIIGFMILIFFISGANAVAPVSAQSDNFGGQVQQNTSQAQQVFQNVNYKKLSEGQDQNYFFGDDQNSTDISELAKQFKLAPEN